MFDQSPVATIFCDPDLRTRRANGAFRQLTGLPEEGLIGRRPSQAIGASRIVDTELIEGILSEQVIGRGVPVVNMPLQQSLPGGRRVQANTRLDLLQRAGGQIGKTLDVHRTAEEAPAPRRCLSRPAPAVARAWPAGDDIVVDDGVIPLARPRPGHFDLRTGYHGDVWLDLDALFLRPARLRPYVALLAGWLREHRPDAVCGPMEGGAFLAQAIADALGTAFLPAARVAAPRAADTVPAHARPAYVLPAVPGGISGWRVAITDDAVNAGTAVAACSGLLRDRGAVPVAVAALLSLGPASTAVAQAISVPFYAADSMRSQAWPAGQCPQCAAGLPLTGPPGSE